MTESEKAGTDARTTRLEIIVAHLPLAALCAAGIWVAHRWIDVGMTRIEPGKPNFYFVLNGEWEPLALSLLAALAALSIVLLTLAPARAHAGEGGLGQASGRWLVVSIAVAMTVFCAVGSTSIYHGFPLSMDEFAASFQAHVFLSGRLAAPVPPIWQPESEAMTPIFINASDGAGWSSFYLPVYSLMKTPFLAIGLEGVLNPILGGLSVLLVAAVARRIWPDRPSTAAVAALLLATSSQFLINSMSYYSMPAHLFLNLLWLYLFLNEDRFLSRLPPLVGVLAMGLHQLMPHLLFAAPFFLYMALRGAWRRLAGFGAVYLVAALGWWTLQHRTTPWLGRFVQESFGIPGRDDLYNQTMNLALTFSWQSLAVAVLVCLALLHVRRLPPPVWMLGLGVIVSFGFYASFLQNQGHGWGYRFIYPVLGNLILFAVAGWEVWSEHLRVGGRERFLAIAVIGALALQLPLRCIEVERTVRPFALAWEHIESDPKAIAVLVNPFGVWYGQDLIRNVPPFRTEAKVINGLRLGADWTDPDGERPALLLDNASRLRKKHGQRVRLISSRQLTGLGMRRTSLPPGVHRPSSS